MATAAAKVVNGTSSYFYDKQCFTKQKHSCLETHHVVFQHEPSLLSLLTRASTSKMNVCMVSSCISSLMTQMSSLLNAHSSTILAHRKKRSSYVYGKTEVLRQNVTPWQAVSSTQPCPTTSVWGNTVHLHQIYRTLKMPEVPLPLREQS